MRNFLSIFFCFICSLVFTQKSNHALVVHVSDAESGLNIKNAKVTLEGFELSPIKGKYSTKDKYYYFDAVPKGYNTVMAYHDKYNEKGFQDEAGLPGTLHMKLFTPYRVRIPGDAKNFYKEDASRLVLVFDDLSIAAIPDCERFGSNSFLCSVSKYVREKYPEIIVKQGVGFGSLGYNGILVERSDEHKFKRFNDPVIKRMGSDKNILVLYGLLLKTKAEGTTQAPDKSYFSETGEPLYRPKYLKYVNFDTINRQTKAMDGKRRDNHAGVNVEYRRKYFKGLLVNDVYQFSKKEQDSLYTVDYKENLKGELFEFDTEAKDTVSVNMYSLVSNMPSESISFLPYKLIANLPEFNDLQIDNKDNKLAYSFYYSSETIEKYQRAKQRFQIDKSESSPVIYRFKQNLASPYGIIDLTEYYNLKSDAIYQKTEKILKR